MSTVGLKGHFCASASIASIRQHRQFHQTPIDYAKMATKLDTVQRQEILSPLLENGWSMDEEWRDAIKKKFQFKDFNEAFGFMTRVALKGTEAKVYLNTCSKV